MRKLKLYSVCVGSKKYDCLFETHQLAAYNAISAKRAAKCCVPTYWKPVIKDCHEVK